MKKYVVIRLENSVVMSSKTTVDFDESVNLALTYVKLYKRRMSSVDSDVYKSILKSSSQINFKDMLKNNITILIEKLDND